MLRVIGLVLTVASVITAQCPDDWEEFQDKCFYASPTVRTFGEALKYCLFHNGHLVNIENVETQNFLTGMIHDANNQPRNVTYHTGDDYVYHYLHDLGVDVVDVTSVSFSVQACNDAHIALSKTKFTDSADTYEIVLGGWTDSQSVIRDCKQCSHMDEVHHSSHPLDCNHPHDFWISWSHGYIRVGKGLIVGEEEFMSWKDPNPHPVHYVAVATGWGSQGDWTFYLNKFMPGKFWAGATDKLTEGEWLWLPDEHFVSTYRNWVRGQPDNAGGNQHCLVLDASSGMQWRDDDCEEDRNFLCQKNLGEVSVIVG